MSRDLENYCWLALRLLLCASVRSTKLTNRHWCVWMHSALKIFTQKKLLIGIFTLFYCNFWCTSHFNTPTLIRLALELKITLLWTNKQSKNNVALNPALTYHYCAIFPALEQFGTECVLDPELSWCCLRKEVDLTKKCDSSSITWVTNGCTAKYRGESLGGGEREEVGLRHSSEEQTNGIGLLILKKNMAMLCAHVVVIVLQLLVAPSSLWLQFNWAKKELAKN